MSYTWKPFGIIPINYDGQLLVLCCYCAINVLIT
uniref:Uncharacterized protein n=1 Tax=Arundo donax TaxID=35708 RepID=A0A0A8Y4G1_ARUDO